MTRRRRTDRLTDSLLLPALQVEAAAVLSRHVQTCLGCSAELPLLLEERGGAGVVWEVQPAEGGQQIGGAKEEEQPCVDTTLSQHGSRVV